MEDLGEDTIRAVDLWGGEHALAARSAGLPGDPSASRGNCRRCCWRLQTPAPWLAGNAPAHDETLQEEYGHVVGRFRQSQRRGDRLTAMRLEMEGTAAAVERQCNESEWAFGGDRVSREPAQRALARTRAELENDREGLERTREALEQRRDELETLRRQIEQRFSVKNEEYERVFREYIATLKATYLAPLEWAYHTGVLRYTTAMLAYYGAHECGKTVAEVAARALWRAPGADSSEALGGSGVDGDRRTAAAPVAGLFASHGCGCG